MNSASDLHGATVLAVDDIQDNLDLIGEFLDGEVLAVHLASSGEEALRKAAECQPDVMLLDLMMPNMNGLAVLRTLRASKALDDIPVILQTAYADVENIVTARRVGCDYFLSKPLTKERLLAEICKCLEQRPRRPARTGDDDNELSQSQKMRNFNMTLADAKALSEAAQLADKSPRSEAIDGFRDLIPNDSEIGQSLIRVANSPAHAGRYPARTVTEAIVRLGSRETQALIQKATSKAREGIRTARALSALEFLEMLTSLFPDRTSTPEGMLTLLKELNAAAKPDNADAATADQTGPQETAQVENEPPAKER